MCFRRVVDELRIKLEKTQTAIRRLNKNLGTVVVTSSSTDESSEEAELSAHSNEIEQMDNEFGENFAYTTNVSV